MRALGVLICEHVCTVVRSQVHCEGRGCYWSEDSHKCYLKYVLGSEGTYAQNYQDWWVARLAQRKEQGMYA